MKTVILAGGQGTRLRPITYEIPKPLITVQKKPILSHLVDFFRRHGVQDTAVVISEDHKKDFEDWHNYWGKNAHRDQKISLFCEEKPLGTFGYFRRLKNWLGAEPFFVSNGDHLVNFDLHSFYENHQKENPVCTLALIEVSDPQNYGVPVMDKNRIVDFIYHPENPDSNFISAGVYVFSQKIFDYDLLEKDYVMIENDVLPALAKNNELIGFPTKNSRLYDCGTLERWEKAIREW